MSRQQRRGVAPGQAGQVAGVDFDNSKIGQRIGADQLGRQHATVGHGHADVHRAVNHVVVRDDVPIGRDDDAAA